MRERSVPKGKPGRPIRSQQRRLRLDDQLCFALYAATNAVTRAYRPLLGAIGLTYPQYLVMLALWQDGAMPANALANRLQLGASAITPLIDQLEAEGFVTRVRSDTDRRVVTIEPTDVGRSLEGSAALAQEAVVCRTGLSEPDLASLREELNALVNRMSDNKLSSQDEPV